MLDVEEMGRKVPDSGVEQGVYSTSGEDQCIVGDRERVPVDVGMDRGCIVESNLDVMFVYLSRGNVEVRLKRTCHYDNDPCDFSE